MKPLALLIAGMLLLITPQLADASWREDKPYELTVIVRFVDSPLMTQAFRDSVTLLAEDQVRNLFGPLATTEVVSGVDKGHWLIRHIAGGGLTAADLSFEKLKVELPQKVFLFEIDHRNNLYHIRWRQLDAELQYISPVYSRTTPDRRWVAKAVCQAVQADFAPVARLQSIATAPAQQRLYFQGSSWPEKLQVFLHDGAVLTPYKEELAAGNKVRIRPLRRTVLKLTKGVVDPAVADVASDVASPFSRSARVLGYRALRLKTTTGSIRVKLIDADTGFPVTSWPVKGSSVGFGAGAEGDFFGPPDAAGFRTSAVRYNGLAYVRLLQGGVSAVNMPVPVTSAMEELIVKVRVDANSRQKSEVLRKAQYLSQDLVALRTGIDANYQAANRLIGEKKYEAARDRFLALGKAVRAQLTRAGGDLSDLQKQAGAIEGGAGQAITLRLAAAGNALQVLQQDEASINRSTRSLTQTIEDITNENLAHNLIEGSSQAIQAGNIEEGIKLLEQALETFPGKPGVAERIASLKQTWQIKSPAHEAARKFVLQTWAAADVSNVGDHLPRAERELAELIKAADYLTLAAMRKKGVSLIVDLAELVEQIARIEPDKLADYQAQTARLQKLNEQVIAAETKLRGSASRLPASTVPSTPPTTTKAPTEAAGDTPPDPVLPELPALPGFEEEEEAP